MAALCLPRSGSAGRHYWGAPQDINDKNVMAVLKAEGFKKAHRVRIGKDSPQLWARGAAGALNSGKMREWYLAETAAPAGAAEYADATEPTRVEREDAHAAV
jgi:hypothetical protein